MYKGYKICKRCVMDTSDPEIVFDINGHCNHCNKSIQNVNITIKKSKHEKELIIENILKDIKTKKGKNKYDCVIGLSGGVDSSYLAYYIVKKLGLKPLAIHLDNGWNSELAINNIENIVSKLNIDLETVVLDWEEFRSLQVAFFKSSVIDLEMLSDNAIIVSIYRIMRKYSIRYFLFGYNIATESVMPSSWFYTPKYDCFNIKDIYLRNGGNLKLKQYPLFSTFEFFKIKKSKYFIEVPILNYIDYNKEKALNILEKELDYRNYGDKHYENLITKFYQAYILPIKFNVDKRRAHLSSLICSEQITRNEALKELEKPLYLNDKLNEDKDYFLKKLRLSISEFDEIMQNPPKQHSYYKTYKDFYKLFSFKKVK